MNEKFFLQGPVMVARGLLGVEIVRTIGDRKIRAVIAETEAYCGTRDKASHASRGRTKRAEVMFGPPGTIYVYLIYGMYYCLNFVVGPEDVPHAVLIRGIRTIPENRAIHGPGRVTQALRVTKFFNNKSIFTNNKLVLGKRIVRPKKILRTPRIGVDYAEEWARKPLRFVLEY